MNQLEELWLEMLQYEKLPETLSGEFVLIIDQPSLERLLKEASYRLFDRDGCHIHIDKKMPDPKERKSDVRYWIITDHVSSIYNFESDRVNQIIIPIIYGLKMEECTGFSSFKAYRDTFLPDERYICAGEFLCCLFRILTKQLFCTEPIVMPQGEISVEDGSYMVWKAVHNPGAFFYFDNTYGGNLKRLQQCQLACLEEFDRICKKYEISYYLGGGTLLGAIRHKEIIPWDDDIDVMMLRDQYEKFVSVVKKEIRTDFFYQSNQTDSNYHSIFDKIRMNDTVFMTEFSQNFPQMHQGIFIDIFVHDRTSNRKWGQKLHVFLTLLARSLVFHKWANTDMQFYGKMKLFCCLLTWYKNKAAMKTLEKIQYMVVTFFDKKDKGFLYDGTGEHLRHGAFPEEWLSGERVCMLNGKEYPVPLEAEKYLAYSYGEDFMQLPAPQNRKAMHPVVKLEFKT